MPFIHFLFLKCRFSNKYTVHVCVTAQASSGNVIVIYLFTQLLLWDLSCHMLSQEESLLLTSSEIRFRHCFFLVSLRIAKTVWNTCRLTHSRL